MYVVLIIVHSQTARGWLSNIFTVTLLYNVLPYMQQVLSIDILTYLVWFYANFNQSFLPRQTKNLLAKAISIKWKAEFFPLIYICTLS